MTDWSTSPLSNCPVKVETSSSTSVEISYGVPQGLISGPHPFMCVYPFTKHLHKEKTTVVKNNPTFSLL